MPKAVVYRIQDVPRQFSYDKLRQAILNQLSGDQTTSVLLELHIFPSCRTYEEECVALIKLDRAPSFLSSLRNESSSNYVLRVDEQTRLKFDRHFIGFTPLNRPDETQGITAEYRKSLVNDIIELMIG